MTKMQLTEAQIAVLEALASEGELLAATPEAGAPAFRSRLLFVDRERQFLVLARSDDFDADEALLSRPRIDLSVEWGDWRIAFTAEGPEPIAHKGIAAVRLRFPDSVSISRRRIHERTAVPQHIPLRCVVHSGTAGVLEGIIVDLSQGGLGMQLGPAGAALEPGMVLAGCRIERPGRDPVVVDLEVRHTAAVSLGDGRSATRAGCRFTNLSPAVIALVSEFSRDKSRGS